MDVYNFDESGKFVGVSEAKIDPLQSAREAKTIFLLPRNATFDSPGHISENEIAEFKNGKWKKSLKMTPEPTKSVDRKLPNLKKFNQALTVEDLKAALIELFGWS